MQQSAAEFQDLLLRWRIHIADCLQSEGSAIVQGLSKDQAWVRDALASGEGVDAQELMAEPFKTSVGERILPECLSWLKQEGLLGASTLCAEVVRTVLNHLLDDALVPPVLGVVRGPQGPGPIAWAVTGTFGAFLGQLCASVFHPEGAAYRQAALLLGGPGGAMTSIALFAALSSPLSAGFTLKGTEQDRPRTPRKRLFARRRARPAGLAAEELARAVQALLHHGADLSLLVCWGCLKSQEVIIRPPQAAAMEVKLAPPEEAREPIAVYEAIAQFSSALRRDPMDPHELREIAEDLLQRFENEGFEWKLVEEGAPYHTAIREDFDSFGLIEPGEPVTTLRAALLRHGLLKKRGLVRRIRPSRERRL